MTTDRIIEILLSIMTLAIGFTTFWLATKSTRIQSGAAVKAVDAAAFDRAKEIYESALSAVREELVETRRDLASARGELVDTRKELIDTRHELASATKEIAGLRRDIEVLQQQLAAHQARGGQNQGGHP